MAKNPIPRERRRRTHARRAFVSFGVHPELRKHLKVKSAAEGVTMTAKFHRMLCIEFDRMDLWDKVPDYRA